MIELILQLDTISKLILGILFFTLAFIILIAFRTMLLIKLRFSQIKKVSKIINGVEDIQDLNSKIILFKNNFVTNLINSYSVDLQDFLKLYFLDRNFNENNQYFDMLQSKIAQKLEVALVKQMTSISILPVLAQSILLIGISGTIWGLLYKLQFKGHALSSDLNSFNINLPNFLAPMFLGLVISVLSLTLFGYLHKKIILLEQELILLTDKFYWKLRFIMDKKLNNLNNLFVNDFKYQQKVR